MSTTPTPAPKVSWLSKVGAFFGKILSIVATDAQPIEKIAEPVALALLPQFAPLITEADSIFSKIVSEAVIAESAKAAVGQATGSGAQKLEAVLTNIGPVLDGWVTAHFPGASAVSTAAKSGLINAVVAILNEVDPKASDTRPLMDIYEQLTRDEGSRNFPYADTVGKITIGVGRNLSDTGLSASEIQVLLANDIARATATLSSRLPYFSELDPVRQGVLINMCFNLGFGGLEGFPKMLSAIAHGDWATASVEMLNSAWAKQVGDRAVRLSKQIVSGQWV